MSIPTLITGLVLSVGLLFGPVSVASTTPAAAGEPATAAELRPAKAPKKSTRKKVPRRYSKATLSAFKPLAPATGSAKPALLKQEPILELKPATHAAIQDLAVSDANEPDVGQDLLAEFTAGGESNALGAESVSVIDRIADKPKAQPLVSGPLRVRVQEKGVRASVQIPLTLD